MRLPQHLTIGSLDEDGAFAGAPVRIDLVNAAGRGGTTDVGPFAGVR